MQTLITECGQQCAILDVPVARKEHRYTIAAKVWFSWRPNDGGWREGTGTTRDISGNGLFVLTDTIPLVGESISVVVAMPPLLQLQKPITYYGYGKVVRIESDADCSFGFAAAVTLDDTNNHCSGDEARLDEELFMRWALLQDEWQPDKPSRSLAQ